MVAADGLIPNSSGAVSAVAGAAVCLLLARPRAQSAHRAALLHRAARAAPPQRVPQLRPPSPAAHCLQSHSPRHGHVRLPLQALPMARPVHRQVHVVTAAAAAAV